MINCMLTHPWKFHESQRRYATPPLRKSKTSARFNKMSLSVSRFEVSLLSVDGIEKCRWEVTLCPSYRLHNLLSLNFKYTYSTADGRGVMDFEEWERSQLLIFNSIFHFPLIQNTRNFHARKNQGKTLLFYL